MTCTQWTVLVRRMVNPAATGKEVKECVQCHTIAQKLKTVNRSSHINITKAAKPQNKQPYF